MNHVELRKEREREREREREKGEGGERRNNRKKEKIECVYGVDCSIPSFFFKQKTLSESFFESI